MRGVPHAYDELPSAYATLPSLLRCRLPLRSSPEQLDCSYGPFASLGGCQQTRAGGAMLRKCCARQARVVAKMRASGRAHWENIRGKQAHARACRCRLCWLARPDFEGIGGLQPVAHNSHTSKGLRVR